MRRTPGTYPCLHVSFLPSPSQFSLSSVRYPILPGSSLVELPITSIEYLLPRFSHPIPSMHLPPKSLLILSHGSFFPPVHPPSGVTISFIPEHKSFCARPYARQDILVKFHPVLAVHFPPSTANCPQKAFAVFSPDFFVFSSRWIFSFSPPPHSPVCQLPARTSWNSFFGLSTDRNCPVFIDFMFGVFPPTNLFPPPPPPPPPPPNSLPSFQRGVEVFF